MSKTGFCNVRHDGLGPPRNGVVKNKSRFFFEKLWSLHF